MHFSIGKEFLNILSERCKGFVKINQIYSREI